MRESPVASQGLFIVPSPFEPAGQSTGGAVGAGGLTASGGGGGGSGLATLFTGEGSGLGSSLEQLRTVTARAAVSHGIIHWVRVCMIRLLARNARTLCAAQKVATLSDTRRNNQACRAQAPPPSGPSEMQPVFQPIVWVDLESTQRRASASSLAREDYCELC